MMEIEKLPSLSNFSFKREGVTYTYMFFDWSLMYVCLLLLCRTFGFDNCITV